MKKLKALFLIVLIGLVNSLFGQNYFQTVRGRVVDADSKSSLPGVNVIIKVNDTIIASSSDADGKYRLEKVPVGRQAIRFTLVGYDDVVMNNIVIESGKEAVLQVEMKEKIYTTDVVEVVAQKDKTKANNELITNSARSFNSEETERYAGSRGDPSKMVANFAGVATGNDARNDIIVRGNSPLGVLWRMEGVDIPNPNHFSTQGASGGAVSMLNNNLLGSTDFITGAFPAEYGNKLAAVFDLKLRNGNNEKHEFIGQIGFNGLEFGAEGPLSKKTGASYLVNYRYSTLELFQALGINFGVSALPKYQDMTLRFNLPTEKAGIFTVWGIGGLSHIELLDSKKSKNDWSFTKKGQDLVFTSGMFAAGVSHQYYFTNTIFGKLTLSASGSQFVIDIDTLSANLDPFKIYQNKSFDNQLIASYVLTDKISAKHLLKFGTSYNEMFFDYSARNYSYKYKVEVDQLKEKNNAGLYRAFAHWQYRLTDKFTLNTGIYYQNFLLNSAWSLEPRAGIRWQFQTKQSFSLAYGMHSQMSPLVYYFFRSYSSTLQTQVQTTNRSLDFSRAHHFIGGYDISLGQHFRFKTEGYYQQMYNVPIQFATKSSFSMINLGNNLDGIPLVDSLKNSGTGFNYGVELTIEKFFSKHYYFLSTLSLFESKYKGSDGVERNTAFNGNYVFNFLGGIEVPIGSSGSKMLSFDLKTTFAGGNRYTPVDPQ